MQLIAMLGGSSFLVICIVGGVRLLLLARRTGQLPERVLGLGLLLMGGVGTPLAAAARSPLEMSATLRLALMLLHGLTMAVGFGGFALFTQRVFRPNARWARLFAWTLPVAYLVFAGVIAIEPGGLAKATNVGGGGLGIGYTGMGVAGLLVLAWAAFEALRHVAVLRRRMRIGLADPVVIDRIQLWGGAMALGTMMSGATVVSSAMGIDLLGNATGMGFLAVLGVVAATGIYLAFLPPAFYLRWVAARQRS